MDCKYPKTPHLRFSNSVQSDDVIMKTMAPMLGKEVIGTEKMDGENTTMLSTHYHARSLDSRHHPSRDWIKRFHGEIAHLIPEGYRICGENLYAKHSIFYQELPTYFMGFSIWNEKNVALDWDETLEWFELLGITPAPTLFRGILDDEMMKHMIHLTKTLDTTKHEGFVTRTVAEIPYEDFSKSVAKWVRKGHVQTDEHWMFAEIVPNKLRIA